MWSVVKVETLLQRAAVTRFTFPENYVGAINAGRCIISEIFASGSDGNCIESVSFEFGESNLSHKCKQARMPVPLPAPVTQTVAMWAVAGHCARARLCCIVCKEGEGGRPPTPACPRESASTTIVTDLISKRLHSICQTLFPLCSHLSLLSTFRMASRSCVLITVRAALFVCLMDFVFLSRFMS